MPTKLREMICIHVGGAGCRMGDAFWDTLCLEHGIGPDGKGPARQQDRRSFETFFAYDGGRYTPRAIFIDTDPAPINAIRTGPNKSRFRAEQFIAGKESAAGNFALGSERLGRDLANAALDLIRSEAARATDLAGFLVFHSVAGGTGSGVLARLMTVLCTEFAQNTKMTVSVFPSADDEKRVTASHNAVLGGKVLMDYADLTVVVDNASLYKLCRNSLGIADPRYADLNRIAVKVATAFTASMRTDGGQYVADPARLVSTIVEYPSMHFAIPNYDALLPSIKAAAGQVKPAINSPAFLDMRSKAFPQLLTRIKTDFDLMYAREAFVHSYLENGGLESSDLSEAQEDFGALRDDYDEFLNVSAPNLY